MMLAFVFLYPLKCVYVGFSFKKFRRVLLSHRMGWGNLLPDPPTARPTERTV